MSKAEHRCISAGNCCTGTDGTTMCDYCLPDKHLAHADGKTTSGPWAFMCELHFARHGVGLGLGRGQVLLDNPVSRS